MVTAIMNAHRDWDAATLVPDCFHPAHASFCGYELAKVAKNSDEPDVARKAIESLGFLAASLSSWTLFERLKKSDDYFYNKLSSYVVLAIARTFQLYRDPENWHQGYVASLSNQFDTLEQAIRLIAGRGWDLLTFKSLQNVLALCSRDRADLFLDRWLDSDHPDLRRIAARTLGEMRLRRVVPHLIERLTDTDAHHEVILALGNIGGPEAVDALRQIVARDGLTESAATALSAAAETVEDPSELEALADTLLDANVSEECFVYHAIGINGDRRFLDRVRRALNHRDPTVRAHSALALARLTGDAEIKRLREMLAEAGSPLERTLIATALLSAGQPDSDGGLIDGLRKDLAVESYMYKRMTRDDFVTVLRTRPSDAARRLADAWSRVYATVPQY